MAGYALVPLPVTTLAFALATYVAYTIIQRCLLSPLARVPGPALAALSYWYECYYDIVHPARHPFKVKDLHDKYGPIVRIGPKEVSISDPDFADTIYNPGPGHKRAKDYRNNKSLGVDTSIGGAITHDLHRRRREPLNPFFSPQRISRTEDTLLDKVTQVEAIFSRLSGTDEVLNLSDVYFAFANDIVHSYCFGNNPNLLGDLKLANDRRTNVQDVLSRAKVNKHFTWIRALLQLLPRSIAAKSMPPGVRDMVVFRGRVRAQIDRILEQPADSDEIASIFTHLRDTPLLPPSEKSAKRLEDEATLMTMAGTYSPMLSLATAHYHVLAQPEILQKLRRELAANNGASLTATQLQQLPYLAGIMQEAHRLTFGLTAGNSRVSPDETLLYTPPGGHNKSYVLPPGTVMKAFTYCIHTNEELFPDPLQFDPDRWTTTDRALLARRRKAMLSFGRGPRMCIGIHLAHAEMALALRVMAGWDMRLLKTTDDDVAFRHDYHVLRAKLGSKGVRVQVVGRQEDD